MLLFFLMKWDALYGGHNLYICTVSEYLHSSKEQAFTKVFKSIWVYIVDIQTHHLTQCLNIKHMNKDELAIKATLEIERDAHR